MPIGCSTASARATSRKSARATNRGCTHQVVAGHHGAVGQPYPAVLHRRTAPGTTVIRRAASCRPAPRPGSIASLQEQRHVRGPLLPQHAPCMAIGEVRDADRLAAHLVAVAVRAVQHGRAPALGQSRDVRQLVDQAGGDQQPPAADAVLPSARVTSKPAPPGDRRPPRPSTICAAVPLHLGPAGRAELGRASSRPGSGSCGCRRPARSAARPSRSPVPSATPGPRATAPLSPAGPPPITITSYVMPRRWRSVGRNVANIFAMTANR